MIFVIRIETHTHLKLWISPIPEINTADIGDNVILTTFSVMDSSYIVKPRVIL